METNPEIPPWLTDHRKEKETAAHKRRLERIKLRAAEKRKTYSRPVTEKEKLATAQALIHKVIRTLKSNGLTLSETDMDDAIQAGMLGLLKTSFFESGIVTKHSFRAISREIEGRDCLRLNARWEIPTEFSTLEAIGVFHEYEKGKPRISSATRAALRACMAALRAALQIDTSRQRKDNFKRNRNFLCLCLSATTNRGQAKQLNPSTFCERKKRFVQYLAKGAKALHSKRSKHHTLTGEILSNLEKNFITA